MWKKEHKRELYIVEDEGENMLISYPGQTYAETVLDEIEPLLFQQLVGEEGTFPAILGATFTHEDRLMAMYYRPERPQEDIYFFAVEDGRIREIPDPEYEAVIHSFIREFPEFFPEQEDPGT
jgi:hypothetical protein